MSKASGETFRGFDGAPLALHRVGFKTGAGRPLILLHGLFSSAQMNWIKFGHAEAIAALGYEVLMPDLRAHGGSAAPHEAEAYPQDVLIRDHAALVAYLGLTDYDLGGFSLGARTVLHTVAKGEANPRRLIVAGMGVEGLTGWQRRAAHFTRLIDQFDAVVRDDPAWMAVQFMKSQKVDRVAARLLLGSFTDLPLGMLDRIIMPTLVVCGEEDHDNGSAADLAAHLLEGNYIAVPGGHMSSVTHPELGRAIASWLGPAAEFA